MVAVVSAPLVERATHPATVSDTTQPPTAKLVYPLRNVRNWMSSAVSTPARRSAT